MKLEIKHLAAYLPYGIKFISEFDKPYDEFGKQPIWTLDGINNMFGSYCLLTKENNDAYHINNCKLILRPLSEFGDRDNLREVHEFIGLGKWCEAYDNYFDAWFNDLANVDKLCLQAPYEIFEYFLENHYDTFGLIPNGLAIDINTL